MKGIKNQMEFCPSWEELNICSDFLFGKIMQDVELCRELLQRILPDLEIDHTEYPELQKVIQLKKSCRWCRIILRMRWKHCKKSCCKRGIFLAEYQESCEKLFKGLRGVSRPFENLWLVVGLIKECIQYNN